MKIGILGGTFNPIHIAHIYIAKEYFQALELDKLILVPTFVPPHKSAEYLVDADQRLEMCKIAIRDYPEFEVCDYEIMARGKSYTYLTLKYLRDLYHDADFYLLMGSDMYMTVQDWRHPKEIYKMVTLCAAEREKGEFTALESHTIRLRNEGAKCIVLDMEPVPLSSTMIRRGIKENKDMSKLLDPEVWKYIRKNGLYGG